MSDYDILVVEDEGDIRDILQQVLSAENLSVLTAEDGLVALELIKTGAEVSLVMCDISMPRMNGLEFFAEALKHRPGLAAIVLTGNDESSKVCEALRLGAIDYLTKPFDNKDLVERVYRCLSISRLRAEQNRLSGETQGIFRKETFMRIKNSRPA